MTGAILKEDFSRFFKSRVLKYISRILSNNKMFKRSDIVLFFVSFWISRFNSFFFYNNFWPNYEMNWVKIKLKLSKNGIKTEWKLSENWRKLSENRVKTESNSGHTTCFKRNWKRHCCSTLQNPYSHMNGNFKRGFLTVFKPSSRLTDTRDADQQAKRQLVGVFQISAIAHY